MTEKENNQSTNLEQDEIIDYQSLETFQKGRVGRKKHLFWKFFALFAGIGMLVLGIVEFATGNSLGIMPLLISAGLIPLGVILLVKHFKKD